MPSEINIFPLLNTLTNKEKKKIKGDEFKTLAAKFNAFQRVMLRDNETEWLKFKIKNKQFFTKNKILCDKPLKDLVSEKILRPKSFLLFMIGN